MGWPPFRAVLDANVLYPALLRDVLLRAADKGIYQPFWSGEILGELTRALQRHAGLTAAKTARLRRHIETAFPEAMTDGYQHLTEAMPNQAKDRHVAAVGVFVGAQVIVTNNVKHFKGLRGGLEPQTADQFLCHLHDLAPSLFHEIISEIAADYETPPQTQQALVDPLSKTVPRFAKAMAKG
jgi:predicted nucleic acid-binding protein